MEKAINTRSGAACFWWKPALFFAVLAVGLWYVKWNPYYGRAFTAAETGSIGKSILSAADNPLQAALSYAAAYFRSVWKATVLGILLGSLVQVLIPRGWLLRTLGQTRFRGTLFGTLFALPGMMCSCCAAPVAAGMRRQNISAGGAMAFWLGNPVLNPATLIFMGFVLGWQWTLIRFAAGLVMVMGVAMLAQRWSKESAPAPAAENESPEAETKNLLARWGNALWQLSLNTLPVYIIAVLVMGAARVWLFPNAQGIIGNNLLWVIAMSVSGCLFCIPTAAEIPIIQTMLLAGMGTAPALSLLITLPAVSLPAALMLSKSFSAKTLGLSAAAVALCGIIVGTIALLF